MHTTECTSKNMETEEAQSMCEQVHAYTLREPCMYESHAKNSPNCIKHLLLCTNSFSETPSLESRLIHLPLHPSVQRIAVEVRLGRASQWHHKQVHLVTVHVRSSVCHRPGEHFGDICF